jgi:hypothetical protein
MSALFISLGSNEDNPFFYGKVPMGRGGRKGEGCLT